MVSRALRCAAAGVAASLESKLSGCLAQVKLGTAVRGGGGGAFNVG